MQKCPATVEMVFHDTASHYNTAARRRVTDGDRCRPPDGRRFAVTSTCHRRCSVRSTIAGSGCTRDSHRSRTRVVTGTMSSASRCDSAAHCTGRGYRPSATVPSTLSRRGGPPWLSLLARRCGHAGAGSTQRGTPLVEAGGGDANIGCGAMSGDVDATRCSNACCCSAASWDTRRLFPTHTYTHARAHTHTDTHRHTHIRTSRLGRNPVTTRQTPCRAVNVTWQQAAALPVRDVGSGCHW